MSQGRGAAGSDVFRLLTAVAAADEKGSHCVTLSQSVRQDLLKSSRRAIQGLKEQATAKKNSNKKDE